MTLNEITDQIGSIWNEMKKLVDAANERGEPMAGEDNERYMKLERDLSKFMTLRDQNTQHLAKLQEFQSRNKPIREAPVGITGYSLGNGDVRTKSVSGGFVADDGTDSDPFTPAAERAARSDEYKRAYRAFCKRPRGLTADELRVLNETTNADGAYLPAQEYYGKLVETRQLANFLRQISTVITLGSKTGNVTFESSLGSVVYEGESTSTSDVTSQFDNLTLSSKKQVFLTKITEELMADDRFDTSAWMSSQIGRAMGQSELSAMLGSASNGPAGLKSIVTSGNSNLVTTASSGVVTPEEIMDVIYTVPFQYRKNAVWVIHDSFAKAIRKLTTKTSSITTANGSAIAAVPYLWEPSLAAGQPDKLLGYPVYTTNVGLDSFAASNKKVALFGDFSFHFIGDRDSVAIRFLDQAFIASGQYGYRAVARHDAGWTVKSAICGLQIL